MVFFPERSKVKLKEYSLTKENYHLSLAQYTAEKKTNLLAFAHFPHKNRERILLELEEPAQLKMQALFLHMN